MSARIATTNGNMVRQAPKGLAVYHHNAWGQPVLYDSRYDATTEALLVIKRVVDRKRGAAWMCTSKHCDAENEIATNQCECGEMRYKRSPMLDLITVKVREPEVEEWRVMKRYADAATDEQMRVWEREDAKGMLRTDLIGLDAWVAAEVCTAP